MSSVRRSFPVEMIDAWPEIFDEIEMNVVPLNYVHFVEITFIDKKIWKVDLKGSMKNKNPDSIKQNINGIITQYEDSIQNIDFKLDIDRIKRDISRLTKRFLKNKKLK